MVAFTTPDGTTRVTIDNGVTTREPVAAWRARTIAKLYGEPVQSADMWQHIGREVRHSHGLDDNVWSRLVAVTDSLYQGWDIHLECCKLQSCFADGGYQVR